ncbi:elongation of very long chain fatty acids protein AAEL008004-like [Argiope bruennichi]|uniref:elongation of very long chain fatty acids protein AAEL008004-like n=1 Tax=Argiope bruennichi TaxID=94029 RepID=UPI0024959299|nr:elongation of very long chain fatty acids protein AAEL008004-like [Argiope bruennichi]XP_055924369.1 elongation of very long chain fatty acids protein AAEL008004-like [Argiope bruennichi]XP_055924370.1 elongation of very long chain fatty acids protein AAEL008004-like [Argiope bruennichi]XP_055924371.1 elongation of very long chain fatty acids protein AAEL008004-like [Argiope bruennichi]XP_055924372.1 elongation of very long chain fatty acids protein AAEL008004-like [Argiope bruennichi]
MNDTAVPDPEYLLKYGDPRMEKYPFMKDPSTTFILVAIYLLFVKVVGPLWMRNRPPYEFRNFMIVYNLLTSALNAWVFFHFAYRWITKYSWRCEPIDFSHNEDALKMVLVCWLFFASKFLEFADTIFAVLRKKSSQVSKLHVFHHSIAPSLIWYAVKFGPGGYGTILMMLNSFVHIWMYLYYGLAAVGPKIQKYLFWKKYVTLLQLAQFVTSIVFWIQAYFFPPADCPVSTFLFGINMFLSVTFFILFINFYMTTYKKRKGN